jgi:general stress protein YciG
MGFQHLSEERRREIASQGGRRSVESNSRHRWTKETAKIAGAKGGKKTAEDHLHMSAIGRSGAKKRKRPTQQLDDSR